jgi:hypothetical protein
MAQGDVPRIIFGFPEFAPIVLRQFPIFFEVAQSVADAINDLTSREYEPIGPHQHAIVNLTMLVGSGTIEVITLVGSGMGTGAMRLVRSLLEMGINAECFRQFPDEFENYRDYAVIEQWRELEYLREHIPAAYDYLDPDVVQEGQRRMNAVRPRFEIVDANGRRRLRPTWCARDLAARSAMTGYEEEYRLINPIASSFVHESMWGLMRHFEPQHDEHRVDVPPSLNWCGQALVGAHACSIKTLRTLSRAVDIEPNPTCEQVEDDFRRAWQRNE